MLRSTKERTTFTSESKLYLIGIFQRVLPYFPVHRPLKMDALILKPSVIPDRGWKPTPDITQPCVCEDLEGFKSSQD